MPVVFGLRCLNENKSQTEEKNNQQTLFKQHIFLRLEFVLFFFFIIHCVHRRNDGLKMIMSMMTMMVLEYVYFSIHRHKLWIFVRCEWTNIWPGPSSAYCLFSLCFTCSIWLHLCVGCAKYFQRWQPRLNTQHEATVICVFIRFTNTHTNAFIQISCCFFFLIIICKCSSGPRTWFTHIQ